MGLSFNGPPTVMELLPLEFLPPTARHPLKLLSRSKTATSTPAYRLKYLESKARHEFQHGFFGWKFGGESWRLL